MAVSERLAKYDLGPESNTEYYLATLASGTITINTGFKEIYQVNISQKAAVGLAVGIAWVATAGALTLDSSDGSGTEVLSLEVKGKR